MGSDADKLAAPRLFGRKRSAAGTPRAAEPARPPKQPKPARPPRELRLPALSGLPAAALTGLVVGAFLAAATFGSLRGCSALRGTSTCGGAAGFPLLLAIGIVAVVIGAALLHAFRVTSPGSDSFLAVALVAVVTTLFLGGHDDAWWMLLVVPALTVAAYALAHWVSVRFIDRAGD